MELKSISAISELEESEEVAPAIKVKGLENSLESFSSDHSSSDFEKERKEPDYKQTTSRNRLTEIARSA